MRTKRHSLIEERYYGIQQKKMKFIRMVQERTKKLKTSCVSYLPNDLMFQILLLLPLKTVFKFTCVCKAWYSLIHCAEFVEAYNSQVVATPIIIKKTNREQRGNTFHLETQLNQLEVFSIFPDRKSDSSRNRTKFIEFLEIDDCNEGDCNDGNSNEDCFNEGDCNDGDCNEDDCNEGYRSEAKLVDLKISYSGSMKCTCNGLILLTSMTKNHFKSSRDPRRDNYLEKPILDTKAKPGKLIVLNPVTRKFIGLPLGTLSSDSKSDLYGLVFCPSENTYKVVHLFMDSLRFVACEVLSLRTRSWRAIDGPSLEHFNVQSSRGLRSHFGKVPISAVGALYWIPDSSNTDYIVSLNASDEKFSRLNLPKTLGHRDRLIEMGGFLSFVAIIAIGHAEVWTLKGLESTEWVKQHTIHIDAMLGHVQYVEDCVPAFALNAKEMVFRGNKNFYVYDFELEEVREIEMEQGRGIRDLKLIPHSNNLATWEPLEPMS